MEDIGLHLKARRITDLEDLGPEDLEARKRLFLAAYTWDKLVWPSLPHHYAETLLARTISICLGRPPSLTEMPYMPQSLRKHSNIF